MQGSDGAGDETKRAALGRALLVALVPALLFAPFLLRGMWLLPYLPVGNVPLSHDRPQAATRAFRDANFALADRIYPILSDQLAIARAVASGSAPTWEPAVNLGAPLFAHTLTGPLYPPNWLSYLVRPAAAGAPLAFLSLALAGLGIWLFLGRLGLGHAARAVGVLAYQVGGFGIANLFYFMKVDAALWLPWSLWAIEGIARGKRGGGPVLAASVALSLLAGFPPITFFCLSLAAAWALVRLTPLAAFAGPAGDAVGKGAPRRLLACALFVALGAAGGAVQIVPMFEASRQSLRTDKTPAAIEEEALVPGTLLGTVVPDLIGAPTDPPLPSLPVAWWLTPAEHWIRAQNANPAEWNTFVGLAVVLLALVGAAAQPRRAWFPLLALVACYGFAQAWPLVRLAYRLPAYNIGAPARVLSVAWLLWPWCAALGVDALVRRLPRARPALLGLSFLATVVAFVVWTGLDPESWAAGVEAALAARYPNESIDRIREAVPPDLAVLAGRRLVGSSAQVLGAAAGCMVASLATVALARPGERFAAGAGPVKTVAFVALALAAAAAPAAARGFEHVTTAHPLLLAAIGVLALGALGPVAVRDATPGVWLPLAAVVLAEGLLGAHGHLPGYSSEEAPLFPETPAIAALRETVGDGRVLRIDTSDSGIDQVLGLARPNMLQVYDVNDMSSHTIFTPKTFIDLCVRVDPKMLVRRSGIARLSDPARLDHPILDLLRVTAVLSTEPLEHPRLERVQEFPGYHLYRRSGALPLARIVPRGVVLDSDEAVLERIGSEAFDPGRETLLAPGSDPGPPPAVGERFSPGQIERVSRPSRDRLRLEIWGSSGGWMVVHEQYYPGWVATVNGAPAPVLRADHALRAVRVPRGDSVVEMRYAPRSLTLSGAVSALSVLAMLGLAWRAAGSGRP